MHRQNTQYKEILFILFYLQFLGEMIIIQTKHPPAFLGQLNQSLKFTRPVRACNHLPERAVFKLSAKPVVLLDRRYLNITNLMLD